MGNLSRSKERSLADVLTWHWSLCGTCQFPGLLCAEFQEIIEEYEVQ
jgi:hypothetical protein